MFHQFYLMFVDYKLNTGLKESEGMFPKQFLKFVIQNSKKGFSEHRRLLVKLQTGNFSCIYFWASNLTKMLLSVGLCKISDILGGFTNFKLLLSGSRIDAQKQTNNFTGVVHCDFRQEKQDVKNRHTCLAFCECVQLL